MALALKPKPTLPGAADAVAAISTAAASTAGTNPKIFISPKPPCLPSDRGRHRVSHLVSNESRPSDPRFGRLRRFCSSTSACPPGGPPKTGGSPRCERASAAPRIARDNQNRLGRSRLTREETCTDEESLDAKGNHVGEDCVLHQPPSPGAVCTVLCTRWNIVRRR